MIGLGYVGLPLVRAFTGRLSMHGFRRRPSESRQAQRGQELHQAHRLRRCRVADSGKAFEPTADMSRLSEADCIIICVPTPLTDSRDPDLSYHRRDCAVDCEDAAARAARRPGEHHLPDDDPGDGVADPRSHRPEVRDGLLPRLQPRARGPGQPHVSGRDHPQGRRRVRRQRARELACALYGRAVVEGRAVSPAWRWPRPARSSRTPTAP